MTGGGRSGDEAIRLIRELHRLLSDDGEVTGLLALMLLTEARQPARTAADGSLIPLAGQDTNTSTQMMSWRVNATGAKVQAARIRASRGDGPQS